MAPGVYETFVVDVVCSTLACRDDRIRFAVLSRCTGDFAPSACLSLSVVQHQPLFRVGFPSHVLLASFWPVLAQSGVVGTVFPCDLGEASDRGVVGLDQCCLIFPECPGAVVPNLARFHPLPPFVWVSACRPVPEHGPLGMSSLHTGVLGTRMPVVMRPSSYDGVECLHDPHCRGWLRCVQGGSYRFQMFEHFFLLWDGQQFFLPAPALPAMAPQEVAPCFDGHNPGFRFAECQSSCWEQFLYAWSDMGFQYLPCWGRSHTVSGVSHHRNALVESCAVGWGFWSSVWPCRLAQPCHPIQCHIRQPWG